MFRLAAVVMSLQGSGYTTARSFASVHHQAVTTRLTHRDYPHQSFPPVSSPVSTSSGRSASSGIYGNQNPGPAPCAAPARGGGGVLDSSFRHPQAAWTPPPFHSSPSRSSPEDLTPQYDYLGAGGPEYVALSAMLSSAVASDHVQV